jgi:hypothetical protein
VLLRRSVASFKWSGMLGRRLPVDCLPRLAEGRSLQQQLWDCNLIRQLMVAVSDQSNPQVKQLHQLVCSRHIHMPAFSCCCPFNHAHFGVVGVYAQAGLQRFLTWPKPSVDGELV